jgi:predicted transcriptional regulator
MIESWPDGFLLIHVSEDPEPEAPATWRRIAACVRCLAVANPASAHVVLAVRFRNQSMSRANYEWRRIPNGPRLAVATLPDSECAALTVHIPPAGSRDEDGLPAGHAHFEEHMVFKGTARHGAAHGSWVSRLRTRADRSAQAMSFSEFDITQSRSDSAFMKATTLRLDERLQESLDRFSALVGKPKNRLINEAVRLFLEQQISETERNMRATLDALEACRTRDPSHETAIRDFAEAEAKHRDPFEGRIEKTKKPVSAEIRRLLHG